MRACCRGTVPLQLVRLRPEASILIITEIVKVPKAMEGHQTNCHQNSCAYTTGTAVYKSMYLISVS